MSSSSINVSLCHLISLHCCILHTRMASPSVWRFFCRRRPSSTRTPAPPSSTTSSSIKPNLTLPRIRPPNRPKPPRRTSRPNAPGRRCPLIGSPCLGGTPRPAPARRPAATHPPLATQHPGATHPRITPPRISSACPPPPHLTTAGQGARPRPPSQNAPRPAEGARGDTFARPPPRLTSPSRLRHRPGRSAARLAPAPCLRSPDQATRPLTHVLL